MNLRNKFLKKLYKIIWPSDESSPPQINIIIFIQNPSQKCLLEKSFLDCLRILIMSWLFKDAVVIMKEIMSWLFKDPIVTVAWLSLDHAQSNSKKGPKKIKLPKMKFFLEKKKLIKLSCTIDTFILQNFSKNSSSWSRVMRMCHFRGQNGPFVLNKLFSTNHYCFHLSFSPFHCAKL